MESWISFLNAVWDQWIAKVGVVFLLLDVVALALEKRGKKPPRWAYRIGAAACILFAVHGAFDGERQKLQAVTTRADGLAKEIAESVHPKLSGSIELLRIMGHKPVADVWALVTVKNVGAPTVADFSALRLNRANSPSPIVCPPMTIPDGVVEFVGGEKARLSSKDSLAEKTVVPIPKGGQARGWLRFYSSKYPDDPIGGIPPDFISAEITVTDVRETETTIALDRKGAEAMDAPFDDYPPGGTLKRALPGVNQPFPELQKPTPPSSSPAPARLPRPRATTPRPASR